MEIVSTELEEVVLIAPKRFGDDRGWFSETWNNARLRDHGVAMDFVQDNHSYSADVGTLRGLHYQAPPHAQTKLVRCSRGAIRDVAVDVRKGSPTFGHWVAQELSAHNGFQLLVPAGFLHGFVTLVPDTEVQYKVDAYYNAAADGSVRWDSVDVDWQLSSPPILSDKDTLAPSFADWDTPFIHETTS